MKSILFPTDFSAASIQAAQYIGHLSNQIKIGKLILYHCANPLSAEMVLLINILGPSPEEHTKLQQDALNRLNSLKKELTTVIAQDVIIECKADTKTRTVNQAIAEVALEEKVDLVAMPISAQGKGSENNISKDTSELIKENSFSLMLIPEAHEWKSIGKVMLACSLRDLQETLPVNKIKQLVHQFQARLFVANVEHNEQTAAVLIDEETLLHQFFDELVPKYHYIDAKNTVNGLLQFIADQQIDLAICVPKKIGMLERLLHKSVTKQLAAHTPIPLLVLHKSEFK